MLLSTLLLTLSEVRTVAMVAVVLNHRCLNAGGPSLAKSVDDISKFGNLMNKFLISAEFL